MTWNGAMRYWGGLLHWYQVFHRDKGSPVWHGDRYEGHQILCYRQSEGSGSSGSAAEVRGEHNIPERLAFLVDEPIFWRVS